MNPEGNINKENIVEIIKQGLYYKIDEAGERIYLGGEPEGLGQFLGILDVEKNSLQSNQEKRREEIEEKTKKWTALLDECVKATKNKQLLPVTQLNFKLDRILINYPEHFRLLEKMGLKKYIDNGEINDSPKLIFQYIFNGTSNVEEFGEIKSTFNKIKTKMEK
jgi:hypothetical protein